MNEDDITAIFSPYHFKPNWNCYKKLLYHILTDTTLCTSQLASFITRTIN